MDILTQGGETHPAPGDRQPTPQTRHTLSANAPQASQSRPTLAIQPNPNASTHQASQGKHTPNYAGGHRLG